MNRENSLEVIDSGANLKQELEQMGNLSELAMRITGKLDYLEMPALNGSLDATKNFYARAFGWAFTDYGPTYSAFAEGLDGGFDAQSSTAKPLPVLCGKSGRSSGRRHRCGRHCCKTHLHLSRRAAFSLYRPCWKRTCRLER